MSADRPAVIDRLYSFVCFLPPRTHCTAIRKLDATSLSFVHAFADSRFWGKVMSGFSNVTIESLTEFARKQLAVVPKDGLHTPRVNARSYRDRRRPGMTRLIDSKLPAAGQSDLREEAPP